MRIHFRHETHEKSSHPMATLYKLNINWDIPESVIKFKTN